MYVALITKLVTLVAFYLSKSITSAIRHFNVLGQKSLFWPSTLLPTFTLHFRTSNILEWVLQIKFQRTELILKHS